MNENEEWVELTEGEEFIAQFLDWAEIDFIPQHRIEGLKGDSKDYRVADFYLPEYDIVVEFFGQWNSGDLHKSRYREKQRVYEDNNIKLLRLYPENLGIIKYVFHERLLQLFDRYEMVKSRRRYYRDVLKKVAGMNLYLGIGLLAPYVVGISLEGFKLDLAAIILLPLITFNLGKFAYYSWAVYRKGFRPDQFTF